MSGKWCFLGPRLNEVLGKGKGKIIHHGMRETVSRWKWPGSQLLGGQEEPGFSSVTEKLSGFSAWIGGT